MLRRLIKPRFSLMLLFLFVVVGAIASAIIVELRRQSLEAEHLLTKAGAVSIHYEYVFGLNATREIVWLRRAVGVQFDSFRPQIDWAEVFQANPHIQFIDIASPDGTVPLLIENGNDMVAELDHLDDIRSLSVFGNEDRCNFLRTLSNCQQLTSVELNQLEIPNGELTHLSALRCLRLLSLHGCTIENPEEVRLLLNQNRNIAYLDLDWTNLDDDMVKDIYSELIQ